jgi:hypothetical protein
MQRNQSIQTEIGIVDITTENHLVDNGDVRLFLICNYVENSDYNILSQPKLVKDYNMHVEYSQDMQHCYMGNHRAMLRFSLREDDFYHLNATVLPSVPFEPAPQFVRNNI